MDILLEVKVATYVESMHEGQKYGDQDYLGAHILKVVNSVKSAGGSDLEIVVAYLHDVVEDTEANLLDIETLFGKDVSVAVDAITKRQDEDREDYLNRVLQNRTARFVKLHDGWCNLCASYASADSKRIRKYQHIVKKMIEGGTYYVQN